MVSLMGARRRADEFAAALDGRTPVDDVSPEIRQLVDVAGSMSRLEPMAPRPEFATTLREQLMAEAETALAPTGALALPSRRRGTRERRLTAAAAAFTLVGGSAGLAVASQQSLPGEALYPIKRGIEDAQLGLQTDAEGRGREYLEQAEDRLGEAERLLEDGATSSEVSRSVDTFVVQAVAGSELLLSSFEEGRSREDVELLRQFASDSLTTLQKLAESAPADIQDELARAGVVLQRIDQQAAASCADCSELPTLEMPLLMAQAAEISRAMEAVRTRDINNDHPAMAVTLPRKSGASSRRSGGQGGANGIGGTGTASGAGPKLDIQTPRDLPRDPDEALKQLDDATGGLVGKVGDTTSKTTKKVTDDVKDTVDGLDDTLGGGGVLGN